MPNVASSRPICRKAMRQFRQDAALIFAHLLIQHHHAARRSLAAGVSRPWRSRNVRRANRTVSAIAARLTRPPRAATISSDDSPRARASSTCHTMMRVPLKVGFPWQISGSATMCALSSIRSDLLLLFFMPSIKCCAAPSYLASAAATDLVARFVQSGVGAHSISQPA
jgi:hypothetical protein